MMKKYMNRAAAIATAAAMVFSASGMNVLAADNKTTDTTTVKYSVEESYTWSVPSEIEFTSTSDTVIANADSGNTQKVKVTKNVIAENKKLQIKAAGSGTSGAFTIQTNEAVRILPYSIKVGNAVDNLAVNGVVLEVNAGTNTGVADLTFTLTKDSVEQAGDYNGTVTYTAVVVSQ